MKKNIGKIDRIARILVAAVVVVLFATHVMFLPTFYWASQVFLR